jgi:DNA replication and repair protein RecF
MLVEQLTVSHFRNLIAQTITFSKKISLLTGINASGKTSVIEALYLLSYNRSFRAKTVEKLIQFGQPDLVVRVKCTDGAEIGLQKSKLASKFVLNYEPVTRFADIAALFPVMLIDAKSHNIIEASPDYRRKCLDWAMFHVEPQFMTLWQRYHKLLKQRNSALRQRLPENEVTIWDDQLAETGEALSALRLTLFDRFIESFNTRISALDVFDQFKTHFHTGWRQSESLKSTLTSNLASDYKAGYTQHGPHRFDIDFRGINHKPMKDVLSRGQQKLFVALLLLSLANFVHDLTEKSVLILIDDLAAELDQAKQAILFNMIQSQPLQAIITCISDQDLSDTFSQNETISKFHVEHGAISPIPEPIPQKA